MKPESTPHSPSPPHEEDRRRYLLTAYLFGDLSEEGRDEVSRWLETSPSCREELADLQGALTHVEDALSTGAKETYSFEARRLDRVLQTSDRRIWFSGLGSKLAAACMISVSLISLLALFSWQRLGSPREDMKTTDSRSSHFSTSEPSGEHFRFDLDVDGDGDAVVAFERARRFKGEAPVGGGGRKGAEPNREYFEREKITEKNSDSTWSMATGVIQEAAPEAKPASADPAAPRPPPTTATATTPELAGIVVLSDEAGAASAEGLQQVEELAQSVQQPAASADAERPADESEAEEESRFDDYAGRAGKYAAKAANELARREERLQKVPARKAKEIGNLSDRRQQERTFEEDLLERPARPGEDGMIIEDAESIVVSGGTISKTRASGRAESRTSRPGPAATASTARPASRALRLNAADVTAVNGPTIVRKVDEVTVDISKGTDLDANGIVDLAARDPSDFAAPPLALDELQKQTADFDNARDFAYEQDERRAMEPSARERRDVAMHWKEDADRPELEAALGRIPQVAEIPELGQTFSEGSDSALGDPADVSHLGGELTGGYAVLRGEQRKGQQTARGFTRRTPPESRLRAYRYYYDLDPALSYEQFSARPLAIPAPAVGDEGLGRLGFREKYGVNPFVDTQRDHLATFAMDVDTASFTRARDLLRAGKLPQPAQIRVEEFVNYFPQQYPADPQHAFSVFSEGGPSPFGKGLDLLKVTVKARELLPGERKNAVLTFCLDTSGSMYLEDRIELVKTSLHTLVQALAPDDKVGIVAYGAQAYLVLPHTPARERSRVLGAIDSLSPRGSSNVQAGIELAYRLADEVYQERALNRVVLCSDGVATAGARGPEEILKKVKVYAQRGIYLSTVGFGLQKYDDRMMERLANEGNGRYDFVSAPQEARRIFQANLPATLQVLAQDAKIQVDFDPSVVGHYRLLGYENRDIADARFRDDTVDAGEVGPGTTVTALFEIQRRPNAHGALGRLFVRYKDTRTTRVEELQFPLAPGVLATRLEDTSQTFRLIACAAECAEILRKSYWARDGAFSRVLALLASLDKNIQQSTQFQELVDLVQRGMELSYHKLLRP